jgi:4-amino-4-deoxy-L-arabinose transferase-like glycosyltransferase
VSLIIYLLVEGFKTGILSGLKKFLILAGICIGYLVLTKPVFGYVLIFMFLGLFFLMLKDFKNINYRKGLIILFTAFIVNAPYLIYTYNLTGRVFYWSNFGGDNLYWMTTPFKGEYGSWYDYNNIENDSLEFSYMIPGGEEIVRSNHKSDYEGILSLRGVEQDDALRKIAICNIKAHPVKFLMNCISNFGRIIFNFPYTFKLQTPRTLVRLPFNGIIMVLALFCLIPTIINWRKIPFAVRFMLVFSLLYLGGSTLGSAETRMFTIIVPVLLTWISFSLQKSVSVKLKFEL